jgi:uncharacterized spore protein YtfJ
LTTIRDLLGAISERIQSSASVRNVYGDPIKAEGKAIIPVAKVRYGFGAGGGPGVNDDSGDASEIDGFGGGGGGGGIEVTPVGFIEITAGETRYVSLDERQRIVKMLVVAIVIALIVLRRGRRRG